MPAVAGAMFRTGVAVTVALIATEVLFKRYISHDCVSLSGRNRCCHINMLAGRRLNKLRGNAGDLCMIPLRTMI